LVVDLLHEYEIGVFKRLFTHVLRILEASSPGKVLSYELDKRFRTVPTFNRTIRKFSSNVSGLKRRAARDYEDILQCVIPVVEGLLPEPLNGIILKLLYLSARWHALAKLRIQTEATVTLLENATTQLGNQLRFFRESVAGIKTVELESEASQREKAAKKKAQRDLPATLPTADSNPPPAAPKKTKRRPTQLNLSIIKFHLLGHYVRDIRRLGPTDLYSSEWVCASSFSFVRLF
ncbi:hypothetical protein DFP72DRAFT_816280, partial [Ephemerocybe angulata]